MRKIRTILLLSLKFSCVLAAVGFADESHKVALKTPAFLFASGEYGYHTFRIPAMTVTNNGTVLAFAEGRKNTGSVTGDMDMVLKRSTDGGKIWSPLQVVWDDQENTCGNPAPVVDLVTQIIDRTSQETRRVFVTQSTDDGFIWTTPVEITTDVKQDNWIWYATCPCQEIQIALEPYKGR